MNTMNKTFIAAVNDVINGRQIRLIKFVRGQREEDVVQENRSHFEKCKGIVVVGKAEEKILVSRPEKLCNLQTGRTYPWITHATAGHYYFYAIDENIGPFFLKVCTYFPCDAKLYINGREYVRRRPAREAIAFEPLDNGILDCANFHRLRWLQWFVRSEDRWLAPEMVSPTATPFYLEGLYCRLSIQCVNPSRQVLLDQALDRTQTSRIFFEGVIRENIGIDRPDYGRLIRKRCINKYALGQFRTHAIKEGVTLLLHIDYNRSRIKECHKEGYAL